MKGGIHRIDEAVGDWRAALQYLKDGNRRYREGRAAARAVGAGDRRAMAAGQNPFAAVVACSDSRVAPEVCFDLSLGDIFVVRNAGNISNDAVLGAVEFAVGVLKVPLVAVVGHSCCAAVINAFNGGDFPEKLQTVMDTIRLGIKGCGDETEAIRANAEYVVDQIKSNKIVKDTGIKVISAFYDIESGEVLF